MFARDQSSQGAASARDAEHARCGPPLVTGAIAVLVSLCTALRTATQRVLHLPDGCHWPDLLAPCVHAQQLRCAWLLQLAL
jgi:hypothetical protein